MDVHLLLQGLLIGFSIAAPVGPIGVLCIRRTLAEGQQVGVATGLGAASADAVFSSIAAFGLAIVATFLAQQQVWIRLIGGALLLYMGVRTLLSAPALTAARADGNGLLGAFASTFVLTLTNPASIVLFSAVFASLGVFNNSNGNGALLVGGVFTGSALWWLLLSVGVGLFRSRFDTNAMIWVNRISGVIILGFGVAAIASLLVR